MQVFKSIKSWLTQHNIEYTCLHHEATPTSEDSARVRGDQLSSGAKAIVYKIQDEFFIFVFAADRRLETKLIKAYFKEQGMRVKKTRFASADELMDLTGLVPGSVPPFGKPILDLALFVDPSLLENDTISFNAGSLTDSIRMKLSDYQQVANPTVFTFTQSSVIS